MGQLCRERQYRALTSLVAHTHAVDIQIVSNENECNICQAKFTNAKKVVSHFKEAHPEANLKTYNCCDCDEVFLFPQGLLAHLIVHKDKYKCNLCGKRHSSNTELRKHHRAHHPQQPVNDQAENSLPGNRRSRVRVVLPTCDVCQATFKHAKEVVAHFEEAHPGSELKSFPCSECDEVFFVNDLLVLHSNIHKVMYKCAKCGKQYSSKEKFEWHEENEHAEDVLVKQRCDDGQNTTTCNICNASFEHSKDVFTHFTDIHPEAKLTSFPCSECEEVFFAYSSLLYHSIYHTDLYKCDHCEKRYASRNELINHKQSHLPQKNYVLASRKRGPGKTTTKCNLCQMSFEHSKELVPHFAEVHPNTKLKTYSCKKCKEVFFSNGSIWYHKLTHTEGVQECRHCGKQLKSVRHLRLHMKFDKKCSKYHTEDISIKNANKPLVAVRRGERHEQNHFTQNKHLASRIKPTCNICLRTFRHSKDVVIHFKEVHPEKELIFFPCKECDEVFFDPTFYQNHANLHTDLFKCSQCGKRTGSKVGLLSHERTHQKRELVSTKERTNRDLDKNSKNANKPLVVVRRDGVHQCNVCDESFKDSTQVVTHFKEVHPNAELTLYPCKQCKDVFYYNRALWAHSRIHGVNKCKHCARPHVSQAELKRHEQCHFTQNKPLASRRGGVDRNEPTCNICATTFAHSKDVVIHFKEVHPEKELILFPCKECDEVFFVRKFYQYHANLHTDLFKCSQCGRRTGSKTALLSHERIHQTRIKLTNRTDDYRNPFANRRPLNQPQSPAATCDVCHETFEHSKEVVPHFKKFHPETELKYFPCKECDEVYFIYRMFVYHSSLHTDRYKCRQCGKRHGSASNLKHHEDSHKKNGRLARKARRAMLKCKRCHKSFKHSEEIIAHYKDVHSRIELKRYHCSECDEVYFSHMALKYHSFIHTDMYKCTHCGKRHCSKLELKSHVKIHKTRKPVHTSEQTKEIKDVEKAEEQRHLVSRKKGIGATTCNICHVVIKNAKDVLAHFKEDHPETELKSYPCGDCEEVFFVYSSLVHHSNFHIDAHKCNYCGKRHASKIALERHYKVHSTHKTKHVPNTAKRKYLFRCTPARKAQLKDNRRGDGGIGNDEDSIVKNESQSNGSQLTLHSERTEPEQQQYLEELAFHVDESSDESPADLDVGQHKYQIYEGPFLAGDELKQTHHGGAIFNQCEFCDKSLSSLRNLEQHMLLHRSEQPYKCKVCEVSFSRKFDLRAHVKKKHRKGAVEEEPSTSTEVAVKLEPPVESEQPPPELENPLAPNQWYACIICGEKFPKRILEYLHRQSHPEAEKESKLPNGKALATRSNGKIRCSLCPAVYKSVHSKKIVTHYKEVHPEIEIITYPCPECEEVFLKFAVLVSHSNIHSDTYACEHCGKRHYSNRGLTYHLHTAHGVRLDEDQYKKCPHCERELFRGTAYNAHVRTHTEEKPFSCEQCGESFKLIVQLRAHHRIHVGLKPFECEACGIGYPTNWLLTRHKKRCPTLKQKSIAGTDNSEDEMSNHQQ